jgi:hypothetical protein
VLPDRPLIPLDDPILRAAAPSCHDCTNPVQRVEMGWHTDEDGTWRPRAFTVCPDGHRVLVEPFLEL